MPWRTIVQDNTRADYLGWLTFGAPASPAELATLAEALGVALPEELGDLLRETNGIADRQGSFIWPAGEIASTNRAMRTARHYRELYMPFDHLVFFADAGNGDLFAFPIAASRAVGRDVFVWSHEDDSRTWVAPSLVIFLAGWLSGTISV